MRSVIRRSVSVTDPPPKKVRTLAVGQNGRYETRFSESACRGRAVRVCGGAGQARNVCVRAPCPAPVTPSHTKKVVPDAETARHRNGPEACIVAKWRA